MDLVWKEGVGRERKKRDNRFVRSLVSSSHSRGWMEGGEKLEIRGQFVFSTAISG